MSPTTVLRRKFPFPSKIQIAFVTVLIVLTFLPWPVNNDQWINSAKIASLFGGLLLLRVLLDLGYRVWHDNNRIYVRADGLGWVVGRPKIESIAFSDIERVRGEFGRDLVLQKRFMPFEYIRIEGMTEGGEGSVMIAPNLLDLEDVRSLLIEIQQRCPESLEPEIVDFAHSASAW